MTANRPFLCLVAAAFMVVASPNTAMARRPIATVDQLAAANPGPILKQAQAALTTKQRYDAETCAVAMPLFDQAFAAARGVEARTPGYSADRSMAYAMLQQGYCKIATGHDADAVAVFVAVARIGDTLPGMASYAPMARACLADAYALGRGIPIDRERALALYALSEKTACPVGGRDPAFEASEIVRALNPSAVGQADSLVYRFLRLGTAKDWWRATQLGHPDMTRFSVEDIRMMMRGLDAGGATPDDDLARSSLNQTLGKVLLERSETTIALGYLQAAHADATRVLMADLLKKQPYDLVIDPEVRTAMPDAR